MDDLVDEESEEEDGEDEEVVEGEVGDGVGAGVEEHGEHGGGVDEEADETLGW